MTPLDWLVLVSLASGISARRTRSLARTGRSRARSASGPPSGFAATTTRGSRRGRRRCRSRRQRRQGAPRVRASSWRGRTGHRPGHASDQSITPVISSPSTNTWVICRSPCVNTGVHGRSAASAIRRLRVTMSVGKDAVRDEPLAFAVEVAMRSRRGFHRAMAAAARRAASVRRHRQRPTPPPMRSTAHRGGRVPSLGGRRARARAASATGPPESGSAPSPSPRPRRRCASDQRRSSGTRRRRAGSRARDGRRRPRPPPRRPLSRDDHRLRPRVYRVPSRG